MDSIEELIEWALSRKIEFNGINPKRLPGRGVGIIATRDIQKDEVILEVPTSCLRTMDTVPKSIVRALPRDISVHGLLAADFALDSSPSKRYRIWNAVCPRLADFASMPLLWPESLQSLLPEPARKLLSSQQSKLSKDRAIVSAAFPDLDHDAYTHGWLLANTRTFYYLTPRLRRRGKEDRMVLQPVADLFNHAGEGCAVAFDSKSFVVRADRDYAADNELRICYGRHSNDFLAVEYGFVMDDNRWDEVGLDVVILPRLSNTWKERLEEASFLGGYVLDSETACHRTQVALRALCCSLREWKAFVDGEDDGFEKQEEVDALFVEMLEEYTSDIERITVKVRDSKDGEDVQRELLLQRWGQISRLAKGTMSRLKAARKKN